MLYATIDSSNMDKKILISKKRFSKTGETVIGMENLEIEAYRELFKKGVSICEQYCDGSVDFYLVESVRIQAVVDHEHHAIMVFKGCLDFMARLASMLAVITPTPSPLPKHYSTPWNGKVRSWLREADFDWGNENYWWLASTEHKTVFDFYLVNLFTFVVLHEVGHIHHMHDLRKTEDQERVLVAQEDLTNFNHGSVPGDLLIHEIISESKTEVESHTDKLARHTREVVADTYGFQFLMSEIEKNTNDAAALNVWERLKSIEESFFCSISTVSSFFWGVSAVHDMDETHQENYYPTHAFRLQAIESTALEHGICGLPIKIATKMLKKSMGQTAKMLHYISGNFDYMRWRLKLQDSIHWAHYREICEEASKWSNTRFRQPDGQR